MGLWAEGVLAFLCVTGAAAIWGLLFGCLVRPSRPDGLRVVLPGRGNGTDLEPALRWLAWLRQLGLFSGEAVLWDAGLTAEGRERALRLALRWPWVSCCPTGALEEWLHPRL